VPIRATWKTFCKSVKDGYGLVSEGLVIRLSQDRVTVTENKTF